MPQRAVVIGGGVIGASCAYYLARDGWEVTLLERDGIGVGCSYANACLIVPSHSHPLPGPGVLGQALRWMARRDSPLYVRPGFDWRLIRWAWQFRGFCNREAEARGFAALLDLSRMSLDLFEELSRAPDLDFYYRREGLLHVYLSAQGVGGAGREQEVLHRHGFSARLLSAQEARSLEPALGPAVLGGLFIEGEAHADCLGFTRALASALEAQGGRVITGREAVSVTVSGGAVRGVTVVPAARSGEAPEELPGDLVVLAAGAWTPALTARLGISIPMQPAKGYSCTFDTYEWAPRIPILIHERRVIVTPLGERVRFGGTLELAGLDEGLDRVRYRAVIDGGRGVLRVSPPMTNEEPWCGFRPLAPDGLPLIGPIRGVEGVLVATGHAMLGLTQAPGTGRLIADLASKRRPGLDLGPFRPDRF